MFPLLCTDFAGLFDLRDQFLLVGSRVVNGVWARFPIQSCTAFRACWAVQLLSATTATPPRLP